MCAVEILRKNEVDVRGFKKKVLECLSQGRKKENNLMIIGPANSGKTFLLRAPTVLFDTFFLTSSRHLSLG